LDDITEIKDIYFRTPTLNQTEIVITTISIIVGMMQDKYFSA